MTSLCWKKIKIVKERDSKKKMSITSIVNLFWLVHIQIVYTNMYMRNMYVASFALKELKIDKYNPLRLRKIPTPL